MIQMNKDTLINEIQRLNNMVKQIEVTDLTSKEILSQSQLVDRLLVEYLNAMRYSKKE